MNREFIKLGINPGHFIFGLLGVEPSPHAPKAYILPLYDSPDAVTRPSETKGGDENAILIDYTPLDGILSEFSLLVNRRDPHSGAKAKRRMKFSSPIIAFPNF